MADNGATSPLLGDPNRGRGTVVRSEFGATAAGLASALGLRPTPAPSPSVGPVVYYKMTAIDPDCVPPARVTPWVVTGAPDTTAAQYTGPRCGASPLQLVQVLATWVV